eukprot:353518-Pelagomonas_calceolata.AAC.4
MWGCCEQLGGCFAPFEGKGEISELHQMTSAPEIKLLLGRIRSYIHVEMSVVAGGHWGSVLVEGTDREGCGHGRRDCLLAHTASSLSQLQHKVVDQKNVSNKTIIRSTGALVRRLPINWQADSFVLRQKSGMTPVDKRHQLCTLISLSVTSLLLTVFIPVNHTLHRTAPSQYLLVELAKSYQTHFQFLGWCMNGQVTRLQVIETNLPRQGMGVAMGTTSD